MPHRLRTIAAAALTLALTTSLLLSVGAAAAAAAPKVVIIVGPTGAQTNSYRNTGDQIAATAEAAGASVTKVYSPNATWANVRAAVNGANVIVYLGHGNGYPNPYSSGYEWTDRVNGWGLNRTTSNGDSDDWSSTMVYCGEKALAGTLTSSDGIHQWNWCGGSTNTDGISPAAGFVMIYNKACYTPGAGEGWDPKATEDQAKQRVRSYSRAVLALGASAYFATDVNASSIVDLVLRNANMTFGDIARSADGYTESAQRHFAHADIPGAELWIQRTDHLGSMDYWYAYAGDPTATPTSGGFGLPFNDIVTSPFRNDIVWMSEANITSGCAPNQYCPSGLVSREQMASFLVRAMGLTAGAGADLFVDDDGSIHEGDIDRLATDGVTSGCAPDRYCPGASVTRAQMASFLVRALDLTSGGDADLFSDDNGSIHEADINRLASAGITSGCGGSSYCPDAPVTREQMAAFLHRAFGD